MISRIALFYIITFGVGLIHNFFSQRSESTSQGIITAERNATVTQHQRQPKLADGCYHVFLDVGSNIGLHARFLFQPFLYKHAHLARNFFEAHFGPEVLRDNRDICVFSFEPNPSHIQRHEEMRKAYSMMGWRYYPIQAGVGDNDGNLTFYHIGDDTGFTVIESSCRKRCDPEHVPVYRLSDWINREVHGRKIPQVTNALHYEKGPRVVMKMDVEMMEWLLFPDLLQSGVLCRDIDGMMGEFHLQNHWFFYPITFAHSRQGENFTIDTWQNATKLKDGYLTKIQSDPNCNIQLTMKDDESHRTDGMPWPNLSNTTASGFPIF